MYCIINIIFWCLLFSLRVNYEPVLWYYGVILMPLIVGNVLVLVLVLVLEATVLETSLPIPTRIAGKEAF